MGAPYRMIGGRRACPGERLDPPNSRGISCLLVLVLLLLFCGAGVQTARAEVLLLIERGPSIYEQAAQGFERGFSDLDQVTRIYLDQRGRLPEVSLAGLHGEPFPRLVVAIGTQAARVAKERLPPHVPIVYCLVLHPEQNDLSGPNIGGVALDVGLPEQFRRIQQVLPHLRRLGVVYDELTSGPTVKLARQHLGDSVQLVARNARTAREAAGEIDDLMRNVLGGADAFWLLWDPVVANPANFKRLIELSLEYRVPLIAPARPFVEAGALMSVGANYLRAGEQAAEIARRILEGSTLPDALEAQPPAEVTVTINRAVQRRLGITFPPDLRAEYLGPP